MPHAPLHDALPLPPRSRAAGFRGNGGSRAGPALVGAAKASAGAQKNPAASAAGFGRGRETALAGRPADWSWNYLRALVAPLTASSALAWTLAVVDSTSALAIWAMDSLAFRGRKVGRGALREKGG